MEIIEILLIVGKDEIKKLGNDIILFRMFEKKAILLIRKWYSAHI